MGKAIVKILGYFLLVIVLSLAMVLAALQLPWGKKAAATVTGTLLTHALGQEVRVGSFEGNFPLYFTLGDLSIADGGGAVWLQADVVSIGIRSFALLSGQLIVDTFHITTLEADAAAANRWWSSFSEEASDSAPWLWHIAVYDAKVSSLLLSGVLPEEPLKGYVSGDLSLNLWLERYEMAAYVAAYGARLELDLSVAGKRATGKVAVTETTGDLLHKFFGGPQLPSWKASATATASTSDLERWWQGSALPEQDIANGKLQASFYGSHAAKGGLSPWLLLPWAGESQISWYGDGSLSFADFSVESPLVVVTGDATFSHDFSMVKGEGAVVIEEIKALPGMGALPLSGSLVARGRLSGAIDHPDMQVQYRGGAWEVYDLFFDSLEGEWQAAYEEGRYHGLTSLALITENLGLTASTHFSLEEDALVMPDLTIRQGDQVVYGNISAGYSGLVAGNLVGSIGPLQPWGELGGFLVGGLADIDLRLSSDNQQQGVEGSVTLRQLTMPWGGAGLLDMQVACPDVFALEAVEIKALGESLYFYGNTVDQLSMMATFVPHGPSVFEVSCANKEPVSLSLQSSGEISYSGDGSVLMVVKTFYGEVDHRPITLQHPTIVEMSAGHFSIADLSAAVGKGSIRANIRQDREVALSLQVDHFPLGWLTFILLDTHVKGKVTGDIELYSRSEVLQGHVDCTVDGLEHRGQKLPQHIEIHGLLDKEALHGKVAVLGEESRLFAVEGVLPLTVQVAPWHIAIDEEKEVEISLQGRLAVDEIPLAILPNGGYASGDVLADLHLAGSLNKPKMSGQILWSEGFYESYITGAIFSQGVVRIFGEGEYLVLEQLSVDVKGGGTISGHGRIQVDMGQDMPVEVSLELDRALLLDVEMAKATISGQLQAVGTLKGIAVSGDIAITDGRLSIPSRLPLSLPDLHPVFINVPIRQVVRTPPVAWQLPVIMNVSIHTEKDFFVSGRGLTSTWQGALALSGDAEHPKAAGTLRLKSGTFTFSGAVFTIAKGAIIFGGEMPQDVFLDVEAELPRAEVTITANLEGPVSSPRLRFSSSPPRTTEEIVALVLFDKSVEEISPMEAFKIGQVLLEVSGESPGTDLIGGVQSTLGLDRLGVTSSSSGNVSLQAGKYILNGVLFSVEKDVYADGATFNLETNLKKGFYLQGQYNEETESRIFLKWRRSY